MFIEIESGEWLHPSGVLCSSRVLVDPFSPAHSTPLGCALRSTRSL